MSYNKGFLASISVCLTFSSISNLYFTFKGPNGSYWILILHQMFKEGSMPSSVGSIIYALLLSFPSTKNHHLNFPSQSLRHLFHSLSLFYQQPPLNPFLPLYQQPFPDIARLEIEEAARIGDEGEGDRGRSGRRRSREMENEIGGKEWMAPSLGGMEGRRGGG
ncbi:hypothetical protein ACH5RR_037658 [Cinchona calisaya]|uniref:Uncharacterized protein n=1 Tax=Cinchona calisaya TaxID=153742 RepID=A0ABD2YAX7_9GENT